MCRDLNGAKNVAKVTKANHAVAGQRACRHPEQFTRRYHDTLRA